MVSGVERYGSKTHNPEVVSLKLPCGCKLDIVWGQQTELKRIPRQRKDLGNIRNKSAP